MVKIICLKQKFLSQKRFGQKRLAKNVLKNVGQKIQCQENLVDKIDQKKISCSIMVYSCQKNITPRVAKGENCYYFTLGYPKKDWLLSAPPTKDRVNKMFLILKTNPKLILKIGNRIIRKRIFFILFLHLQSKMLLTFTTEFNTSFINRKWNNFFYFPTPI